MNDRFSKATGLTFAAFIALVVGLQWEPFFKGLSGFPAFVQALATGLPFGFWSTALSLILAAGIWGFIFTHSSICAAKPHSCADTAALMGGVAINLAQQWAGGDGSPKGVLMALLLGLFAGLAGMYGARLVWSLFAPPKDDQKP